LLFAGRLEQHQIANVAVCLALWAICRVSGRGGLGPGWARAGVGSGRGGLGVKPDWGGSGFAGLGEAADNQFGYAAGAGADAAGGGLPHDKAGQ